jgi:hypothetical protein
MHWTGNPSTDSTSGSNCGSATRTGAPSRLHPWKMDWKQVALPSIRSIRKPAASLDRPSAPNCRSEKQDSEPNTVCCSWFLLVQSTRGCSIRTRMNAVRQRLDAIGCWFGRVSQFRFQRLTRSIHRSYVVKSGVKIVDSQARGGFQSAHHDTGKNSRYSGALVRIQCSWISCKAGNCLHSLFTIPPYGIVKKNRRFFR